MNSFSYTYDEEVFNSTVEHFMDSGKHRYRVSLPDGYAVILKSGFPKADGKPIWVQNLKPGERELDHSLVQAIGEPLEHAELIKNTPTHQSE